MMEWGIVLALLGLFGIAQWYFESVVKKKKGREAERGIFRYLVVMSGILAISIATIAGF